MIWLLSFLELRSFVSRARERIWLRYLLAFTLRFV
jgi:hypothetical protein